MKSLVKTFRNFWSDDTSCIGAGSLMFATQSQAPSQALWELGAGDAGASLLSFTDYGASQSELGGYGAPSQAVRAYMQRAHARFPPPTAELSARRQPCTSTVMIMRNLIIITLPTDYGCWYWRSSRCSDSRPGTGELAMPNTHAAAPAALVGVSAHLDFAGRAYV